MLFRTKAEFLKFAEAMMDKNVSYYAFEMLYWCGLRLGELLALTSADFDFEKRTVRINKSYQRINGEDVITDPKTTKSIRTVTIYHFKKRFYSLYSTICLSAQDMFAVLLKICLSWSLQKCLNKTSASESASAAANTLL